MKIMYIVLLYTYEALHEYAIPNICEIIEMYIPMRLFFDVHMQQQHRGILFMTVN